MNICSKIPTTKSLSFFSNLIDHCLSSKSTTFAKLIHVQLVKSGFNTHTYLGNRLIDLYSKLGLVNDAIRSFDDIAKKNIISWNICLKVYLKCSDIENACVLFDKMPERDVVTWNSLISGFHSSGFSEYALDTLKGMQDDGFTPDVYTYTVITSCVRSARHGMEVHGRLLRSMVDLNVVVGNSLIDMYGTFRLLDYAFGVFSTMEERDVISWNSLISSCYKSGDVGLGLEQFRLMMSHGYSADHFTISTVTIICTNSQNLENGTQIFALCIKLGSLSNAIVSSATIDMFSKCDRLEDAIQLFDEINVRDNIVCNAMISSYASFGFGEEALDIFLLMLKDNLKPTEFTISSVLSAAGSLGVAEQGSQIHSLVVKLGLETDMVVASSLLEMYAKFGDIVSSKEIFTEMNEKDLISWNIMILGLTQNGRPSEALQLFEELLENGPPPDRISLLGVIIACNYAGFVNLGTSILLSMEKNYGVRTGEEHNLSALEMLIRAGKFREVLDFTKTMPCEPSTFVWELILGICGDYGDLDLIEKIAEKLIECKPRVSLPYLVLAHAYEIRGKWECIVRVRRAMKENNLKTEAGFSWISIRNHISVFKCNHLFQYKDRDTYLMLKLLAPDMTSESLKYDHYD